MLEVSVLDKIWLVVLAYAVGSVPFGVFIAGYRGIDIRTVGSGNIGATNVARAVGTRWAVLTGICDISKGAGPVLLAIQITDSPAWVSATGFAAVLGHCASVFLDFRGGKGVATAAGVMLILAPIPTVIAAIVWMGIMAWRRISSVAALVALPVLLILLGVLRSAEWIPLLLVLGGLIVWRHKENVRLLRTGSERGFERRT